MLDHSSAAASVEAVNHSVDVKYGNSVAVMTVTIAKHWQEQI